MFTTPSPITVVAVKDFVSDDVQILGKAHGSPQALLSFVAVDSDGKRVPDAPISVFALTGAAYNEFYARWNSESDLYASVLDLATRKVPGCDVSGIDLTQNAGLTATDADEVIAA